MKIKSIIYFSEENGLQHDERLNIHTHKKTHTIFLSWWLVCLDDFTSYPGWNFIVYLSDTQDGQVANYRQEEE